MHQGQISQRIIIKDGYLKKLLEISRTEVSRKEVPRTDGSRTDGPGTGD